MGLTFGTLGEERARVGQFPVLLGLLNAVAQGEPDLGDWHWDREAPVCSLRQQTPSSSEIINVTRTPGNDETEVTITSRPPRVDDQTESRDGWIGSYPGEKSAADVTLYLTDKVPLEAYAVTQNPSFMQSLAGASEIEISHPKFAPIRRPIRLAAAVVDALRKCEDRKMREWGVDPVAWRALRSRPIPLKPVRARFSNMDYPADALAQGIEADAVTRLDVGPDGRVISCKAVNSANYKGFADVACRILKGAKFRPALDGMGNPVSAPYLFDVRFRIAK
jgi:TonB family protein